MQYCKNLDELYSIKTEGPHLTLTIQQVVLYSPLGMEQKAPSLCQLLGDGYVILFGIKKAFFMFDKAFLNLTS